MTAAAEAAAATAKPAPKAQRNFTDPESRIMKTSDGSFHQCYNGQAADPVIATGRQKHGETPPPAPRGRIPARATRRERMARKTRTKKGKAAYCRRKAIVEPVFGQMKTLQDAGHLLLRGHEGAHLEWMLLCACHNLRKLFGARGIAGLRGLAPA